MSTDQIKLPTVSEVEHSIAAWRAEQPQLDALLLQNAQPAAALRFLGLKHWNAGQLDTAIGMLTAAVALSPDDASTWNDLGGAYYASNRPDDACACLSESLARNMGQPRGWLLLATIQSGRGNDAEAQSAFLKTLELDPQLADASVGLGLLHFRHRRFREAADRLRAALDHGDQTSIVYACLGQALYLIGDFSGAASALTVQVAREPADRKAIQRLALIRLIETVIGGDVDEAIAKYRAVAGPHADDLAAVTRTAFHLLSGYGHREAAIKLGLARSKWAPDDPMQRYLLAALEGEPLERAPDDYIIDYFNRFADEFDRQLVDVLGYKVPQDLCDLLKASGRTFSKILDLGCGTGLAGPLLHSLGGRLTGVDLAGKMLKKAAERNVYETLIEAEIISFLERERGTFDLIFAADVLVYVGCLTALLAGVTRALEPGGVLALSVETTDAADYVLLPSGRFAHRMSYLEHLLRDDFILVQTVSTIIRLEANEPVAGVLVVLKRR